MASDYKDLWLKVLKGLEPKINRVQIINWFKNTVILGTKEKGIYEIGLPLPIFVDWHEKHYKKLTLKELKKHVLDAENIVYKVDMSLQDSHPLTFSLLPHFPSKGLRRKLPKKHEVKLAYDLTSKILNPKYTLENFIVGSNSRLVHAACMAVSEKPGVHYNPLFIYGDVGLGKTHLLQATGNEILKNDSEKVVIYATSEDFTNEVVEAIQSRKMKDFRDRYRNVDVLIIDDIQFIANKDRTQEEFFHTFNTLYEARKQIIISSDRPPSELDILEPRLKSRFEWGMIADVQFPDFETRLAILHHKAKDFKVFLTNEVLEFMASNVHNSVRELEGVLMQAIAQFELTNQTPTVKSVGRILSRLDKKRKLVGFTKIKNVEKIYAKTFDELIDIISEYFKIPTKEILGHSRVKEVSIPRQIAMYLGKKKMGISLKRIGETFRGRNHSTVLHSIDKIDKQLKIDRQLIRDVNSIKEEAGLY